METAVISGRVDMQVKKQAAVYIQRTGQSAADVVKTVWENIAATGEVPEPVQNEDVESREETWNTFMAFCEELDSTPAKFDLSKMTDQQIRDLVVERYV